MLRSLYSAVAGSRSHQVRMDVIANNIANVNTTAFKAGRASFQEVLAQTLRAGYGPIQGGRGSINPMQVGIGSAIKYIDQNFTPGNLENTDKFTDMAIEGDGFFVVSDGTKNMYTRDGHFSIDSDGFLEASSSGVKVQGWMADKDGNIDRSKLTDLRFEIGKRTISRATDKMVIAGNLDATHTNKVTSSDEDVAIPTLGGTFNGNVDQKVSLRVDGIQATGGSGTLNAASTATGAGTVNAANYSGDAGALVVTVSAVDAAGKPTGVSLSFEGDPVDAGDYAFDSTGADSTITYKGATYTLTADPGNAVNNTWQFDMTAPTQIEARQFSISTDGGTTWTPVPASDLDETTPGQTIVHYNGLNISVSDDADLDINDAFDLDLKAVYTQSVTVYDSLGNEHLLDLQFNKVSSNDWSWTLFGENGQLGSGQIVFSDKGVVVSPSSPVLISNYDPGEGAAPVTFNLDMSDLTQYALTSSAKMESQSGYPVGTLDTFTVGPQGIVTGVFSNQQTLQLGQVAVASFANPSGLIKVGDSCFEETLSSGQRTIGAADTEGRGTLKAMSLEMSNVDLSQEFTDMIVTQRGFQANSKVITTSDEILQDLMNLKR